jgi:hypothetical protein
MRKPRFTESVIAPIVLSGLLGLSFSARGQGTFSLSPVADAFVAFGPTGNLANNNYGGGGALALAAGSLPQGAFQSVIQFNLGAAVSSFNSQFGAGDWTVQSVTLELTSTAHNNAIYNNAAAGQFNISLMQSNSWVEGTGTAGAPTTDGITYNTLMSTYVNPATDQALGTFSFAGGSSGANNYALTLTSGLLNDVGSGGELSLRLYADDNNVSYLFSSRMAGSGGPELLITAAPEPATLELCAMGLFALVFVRPGSRRCSRRSEGTILE